MNDQLTQISTLRWSEKREISDKDHTWNQIRDMQHLSALSLKLFVGQASRRSVFANRLISLNWLDKANICKREQSWISSNVPKSKEYKSVSKDWTQKKKPWIHKWSRGTWTHKCLCCRQKLPGHFVDKVPEAHGHKCLDLPHSHDAKH